MIYAQNSKTNEVNILRFCTFFLFGTIPHDCCKTTSSIQIVPLLILFEKIAILLIVLSTRKRERKKKEIFNGISYHLKNLK
jgi:hypothetical protein